MAEALRSAAFFRHLARLAMPPQLRAAKAEEFTPEKAAAARERLIGFVEWLEGTPMVREVDAIRDYLAGRHHSLDAAFGLVAPRRPRGAPPDLDRKLQIAWRIDALKGQGKEWSEIADALSHADIPGAALDESSLRRIYRDFQTLRRRIWSSGAITAEIAGAALDLVGLPEGSPPAVKRPRKPAAPAVKSKRSTKRVHGVPSHAKSRQSGRAKQGGQ